jgi:hypothetical protein
MHEAFHNAGSILRHAGIAPDEPKHALVIRELLEKKGPISKSRFIDILGPTLGKNLLEDNNVFAESFGADFQGEVDFQSTMMRRYCQQKWWEVNEGAKK